MKWGVRKYVAPTQKDQSDAVRAFTQKTGKPPEKGATIAVVNGRTNNLHVFTVNKVKTTGLLRRQKIYDMTHDGTYAIDKDGKAGKALHTPSKKEKVRTVSILHSDDVPDYLAMQQVENKDAVQYGVKGQQWGVRRSSAALRAAAKVNPPAKQAAKKTEAAPAKKATAAPPAKKPEGNIQDNVESSPARYARLADQAKSGKASEMSEQDLKFFNARTEALSKIDKLNETQPGWLRETSVRVLQQSAQRQMQSISDTVADKYIGDVLKGAIKKEAAETVEQAIASGAAKKLRDQAIEAGIKAIVDARKS